MRIECLCGFMAAGYDLEEARQIWNTRAPILSAKEMEMLEEWNERALETGEKDLKENISLAISEI